MKDPFTRFRQRRVDEATRARNCETTLAVRDFIWPVFLVEGRSVRQPIASMPDVYRFSADTLLDELVPLTGRGLASVLLFGVPATKGIEQAWAADGIVQQAVPLIKRKFPALEVITDVCLCSFTADGHCHVGDNDKTCELLARIAVSHATAGADIVAPSDMMDGRVWFIKQALTAHGFAATQIMSYAAKYASGYYGPFRDAADCAPKHGDRKTYQMDPANAIEAMDEIAADIEEGATSVIVKPALAYLDIIARARQTFSCPIVAYNVSGEYTMLKHAVASGAMKSDVIPETLLGIKRAGAHRIISYFTPDIVRQR